jgi:hypothetical protein
MISQSASCGPSLPSHSIRFKIPAGVVVGLVLLGLSPVTALKGQQHPPKIPVLDKITFGGPTQQAFSGIIKSVDLESEVLNVNNVKGSATEIFPIKKKTHIVTADGDKVKLATLKPGSNVLIYYEQRGDHKTVTRIVVLAGGEAKKKDQSPPS